MDETALKFAVPATVAVLVFVMNLVHKGLGDARKEYMDLTDWLKDEQKSITDARDEAKKKNDEAAVAKRDAATRTEGRRVQRDNKKKAKQAKKDALEAEILVAANTKLEDRRIILARRLSSETRITRTHVLLLIPSTLGIIAVAISPFVGEKYGFDWQLGLFAVGNAVAIISIICGFFVGRR